MRLPILASLSLILAGCTAADLQMAPALQRQATYRDGIPSVLQEKGHAMVGLGVPHNNLSAGEPLALIVSVGNKGAQPFTFGPGNVTASLEGKPLKVFSYEEMCARETNKLDYQATVDGTLRRTTIASGQVYGGVLRIASPGASSQERSLVITLRVAGQTFTYPLLAK